jgi:hypothetical protein
MTELSQLPRNSFDVDDSLSAARAAPSRVQGGGMGDEYKHSLARAVPNGAGNRKRCTRQRCIRTGILSAILVVGMVVWAVMGFPETGTARQTG